MPTLLLIRHGQASFGAADYDVLSPVGAQQAGVVAASLDGVDRVISGTLGRQRGTAKPIADAAGCALELDGRWDEYDADAILEHHSDSDVRQDRPPGSDAPPVSTREFQQILEGALHGWIGAGEASPCALRWPAFAERVTGALHELGGQLRSGETAVVVTSGGVLAAVCVELLGVPAPAFVAFNRVTVNAAVTRVVFGRSGATLVSFNEHAHLLAGGAGLLTYR